MSKMVISEERLQELVRESIYEVLNESEFDEGFGHWLGQTYQGIKNKWNNFKKDFNAGRDKARFDNKDYNGYSHYGDEESELRKMSHGGYGDYRYNLEKERNNAARGQNVTNDTPETSNTPETQNSSTTQNTDSTQSNNGMTQPHPSLSPQNNTNNDGDANNPTQNKRTEVQTRFNNGDYPKKPESWMRTPEPSDAVYGKRMAIRNLERAGIVPQNGDWNKPSGWKNVNGGKLTPDQKKTIQTYNKFLFEEKLNELNKILNEIKTVRIKNK